MEEGLRFHYDEKGDVLDVSIGEPEEAISKEIKEDFFVRVDPETDEVVGFMMLNFEKILKNGSSEVPIKADLSLA